MQISSNGMNTFQNPYASSMLTSSQSQNTTTANSDQIANEFHLVAENLTPAERKLYDSLMFSENYEAAKGIVAIGFLRSVGMYQDGEGNQLSGISLRDDLAQLTPPADPRQNKEIQKLQDYLTSHPRALDTEAQQRGNIIDFKV